MNLTGSRLTIALTSLALLLGACSGQEAPEVDAIASSPTAEAVEESERPSPEPEPEPTQQETTEPEPDPEQPDPEPAGPCEGRAQQGHSVTAVNFDYNKSSITEVCSGDTVTLTIAEGSHSFTVVGAEGDTGVFGTSEGSRTTTVTGDPGTYQFRCTLHPNQMSGQIDLIG